MSVGALVLAAGGSIRLGEPKQLLLYRGQSFVRRAVAAALDADCEPVVVVVGRDRARIAAALRGLPVTLVPNDDWERGIGSSIRLGTASVENCSAIVIIACDQPQVSRELLRQLRALQAATGKPIIASAYAATRGVPALFAQSYFEALVALPDGEGAKAIIAAHPEDVATVDFPEGAIDIDTPGDYLQLPNDL
ncbi:MAG: nucleotidyltransferase family protein [Verrucomicrobiota bacterium]